jgi:spore coat polysaccharide biosynthesis protein SpsF (cytidylyltransferase family)
MRTTEPHYKLTRVLLAIQARSTSRRFPNKAAAMIGGKSMTEWVISAAEEAAKFLSKGNFRNPVETTIALLVPKEDPLVGRFESRVNVIQGSEADVLGRFERAYDKYRPDYICRITGDCPMLPDYVISKHVRTAIQGGWDYVCNCDPELRTAPDGYDCEVVSRHLMKWVFDNAKAPSDREHVTTLIRSAKPEWARDVHLTGYYDQSHVKLSVDTPDDLERVRAERERVEQKITKGRERPNSVVYRF